MRSIFGKLRSVGAVFFRNAFQPAAIKLNRVELSLPVIILIGGEVDDMLRFIHRD